LAILEKEVWVTLHNTKIRYYEEKGYEIPRRKDKKGRMSLPYGTRIKVKTEDLSKQSNVKVTKVCDECGSHILNQEYALINRDRNKGDGLDRCINCGRKRIGDSRRNNLKYVKSLEHLSKKEEKEYLLKEFSENNIRKPSEISYKTQDEYLWNCPNCKTEYKMSVAKKTGRDFNCPFCSGYRVNHTNCLWTTHPNVAKILVNSQEGYEVTGGSHVKLEFNCTECGFKQFKNVYSVVRRGLSCRKCSDNISYPEKFVFSLLDQLDIAFETQKKFEWSDGRLYDFYIPSLNCIIETHGDQHFNDKNGLGRLGRTFDEETKNDEYKMSIAKVNNIINYVVLECRESNLDYIKNSVLSGNLKEILNLNNANWIKTHEYACSTLVKTICNLWSEEDKSITKIIEILKLSRHSVIRYLKQGNSLGWCNYDSKEEMRKNGKNNGEKTTKKVVQLSLNGEYIKTWLSATKIKNELDINRWNISAVCTGKRKATGGFKWMYEEDYDNLVSINVNL
jgi:hypothetical protein